LILKILITAGATREPIDDIRFISNASSGNTACNIAKEFSASGFEVTLVAASYIQDLPTTLKTIRYTHFASLDEVLRTELSQNFYDAVIHLAAVSDYSIDYVQVGGTKLKGPLKNKIESKNDLVLGLKKNFKILEKLKAYSNDSLKLLVAFKLTSTLDPKERKGAVEKLFEAGEVDCVVHNDLSEIAGESTHKFEIFHRGQLIKSGFTKQELSQALVKIVRSFS
jgi:phosphopantothenoylcysteine synthetase/decarboxylase